MPTPRPGSGLRRTPSWSFHADLLGEAEHDGWMDWHFSNGWSQAEKRSDAHQLHNRLVPYRDLAEDEKAKDRAAIHHYPDIAERAGLKIVQGGHAPAATA